MHDSTRLGRVVVFVSRIIDGLACRGVGHEQVVLDDVDTWIQILIKLEQGVGLVLCQELKVLRTCISNGLQFGQTINVLRGLRLKTQSW